jgi:hypothetical protein
LKVESVRGVELVVPSIYGSNNLYLINIPPAIWICIFYWFIDSFVIVVSVGLKNKRFLP